MGDCVAGSASQPENSTIKRLFLDGHICRPIKPTRVIARCYDNSDRDDHSNPSSARIVYHELTAARAWASGCRPVANRVPSSISPGKRASAGGERGGARGVTRDAPDRCARRGGRRQSAPRPVEATRRRLIALDYWCQARRRSRCARPPLGRVPCCPPPAVIAGQCANAPLPAAVAIF